MLKRLTRIVMALVTAFVFTGQMEAAAQHCARLAEQAAAMQPVAQDDEPPCHQMQDATAQHHDGRDTHQGRHKVPDRCECIAALKTCGDVAQAQAASNIEPYAWASPEEAHFVSHPGEPGWRPPRI